MFCVQQSICKIILIGLPFLNFTLIFLFHIIMNIAGKLHLDAQTVNI